VMRLDAFCMGSSRALAFFACLKRLGAIVVVSLREGEVLSPPLTQS
jgi:hypothetical protein